jgi:cell division septation protein DedD
LGVDLRDELDVIGFPAVVHSEKRQETIWHRVMVGPYPDEGKALRVRQQLEDRLGTPDRFCAGSRYRRLLAPAGG